jgi:S-adenosylmethionine hydrolase
MASRVVALLSDFGLEDWYVGVMKSVVLTVNPKATVLDVVHTIPRQNVLAGSFALRASYGYLPPGAVVVAVVDPGVGTGRRILCAEAGGRLFLAPDNGILSGVLAKEGRGRIVSVENDEYFLKPVSSTFHGRDIFASVAGHLSLGLSPDRLGPEVKELEMIEAPLPEVRDDAITLTVEWIDSFGNLITDCSEALAVDLGARWGKLSIAGVGGRPVSMVVSYESAGEGELLAIIGSSGYLEISVREGSASQLLGLEIGDRFELKPG